MMFYLIGLQYFIVNIFVSFIVLIHVGSSDHILRKLKQRYFH